MKSTQHPSAVKKTVAPRLLAAAVAAASFLASASAQAQLYAGRQGDGDIGKYNATTGAAINASFIPSGLNAPDSLAIAGNNLYVNSFGGGYVGEYNAATGGAINANLVSGLNQPISIAVSAVPEPSTWAMLGLGLTLALALARRRPRAITASR